MRVIYRESGGFTGLVRGCDLDTDRLASKDAKRLQDLVRAAGLLDPDVKISGCAPEDDEGTHRLEVEDGERSFACRFTIMTMAEALEPVVEFLSAQSKAMPLDE